MIDQKAETSPPKERYICNERKQEEENEDKKEQQQHHHHHQQTGTPSTKEVPETIESPQSFDNAASQNLIQDVNQTSIQNVNSELEQTLERINEIDHQITSHHEKEESEKTQISSLRNDLLGLDQTLNEAVINLQEKTLKYEERLKQQEQKQHEEETRRTLEEQCHEQQEEECDKLSLETRQTNASFDRLFHSNNRLQEENRKQRREIDKQEERIRSSRQSLHDTTQNIRDIDHKINKHRDEKKEYERQRDVLQLELKQIRTVEMMSERKNARLLSDHLAVLQRESRALERKVEVSERSSAKVRDVIQCHENVLHSHDVELRCLMTSVRTRERNIEELEERQGGHERKLEMASKKYECSVGDRNKTRDQISDIRTAISKYEGEMEEQKLVNASLVDENDEHRKKFFQMRHEVVQDEDECRLMTDRIKRLKEMICRTEESLFSQYVKNQRAEFEKEGIQKDIQAIESKTRDTECLLVENKKGVRELVQIMDGLNKEREGKKKQEQKLIINKGIANSELLQNQRLLKDEKKNIKVQRQQLSQRESELKKQRNDISRVRDEELKQLLEENNNLILHTKSNDQMKRKILSIEKDLLHLKARNKVLSDEMMNNKSINVHAWRQVKNVDPERYRLMRQGDNIRRCLLGISREIDEKDSIIREKEELFTKLRERKSRQMGLESAQEQLEFWKSRLKKMNDVRKEMESQIDVLTQGGVKCDDKSISVK